MALLLAMYQKMRLVREKNELSLDLIKTTSKFTRIQKNIKNVEKMFAGRKAKLEAQAKLMASSMKSIFQQASGLAINNSAYLSNPQMYGGNVSGNAYIQQRIQGYMQNGIPMEWVDGENGRTLQPSSTLTQIPDQDALKYLYQNGAITPYGVSGLAQDENGNYTYKDSSGADQTIPVESVQMFQMVLQQSSLDFNRANMCLNQANTDLDSNISIWLQQQEAQLEAEQDLALEPLSYEETMLELDKTNIETRLKMIEEEINSYNQLVDNEAKNMAPKFGLG